MKWLKKGYSFKLNNFKQDWQLSHAMMPVCLDFKDFIRVFYTTRHKDGKSRICFYDTSKNDPSNVLRTSSKPVLDVGKPGTFDDCGTVSTFVTRENGEIYLYYNGYNVRNTVPWSNSIGLAVSKDNGETFHKVSEGPIFDRSMFEPYFCITPCCIKNNGKWHIWYTSGTAWLKINGRMEPTYNIKYAKSDDGISWSWTGHIAIEQENFEECTARPTILQEDDKLHMWFIHRGSRDFRDGIDSYQIGYAISNLSNPIVWERNDNLAGIEKGPDDYDSKMVCYPYVIKTNNKVLLFYNGNNFGKEGILYAELDDFKS